MVLRVRVALGHLGHVAPGYLVRMAGASMAGMLWVIWVIWVTVFYCMAMHALGHLGHLFCIAKVTQSMGHARHAGAKALGHLGHLVIDLKSVAGAAWA
jgi:hypothetical protein